MENIKNTYIPGVCNIGPAEIATRKRLGWYGLGAAIIIEALFVYFNVTPIARIIIFVPIFSSASGFIQGFMHFCAGFGMKGVFNFGDQVGKTDTVSQAEFRKMDRKKAQQIFLYSLIIGIGAAALAFYL